MNEKSEAFTHFKNFKSMIDKETDLRIECLRTDKGGEFVSYEFNQFCIDSGIKRNLTTTYTPQQNGVAERKNRTIMNMVRSLLSCKFWPEAARWTMYLLNKCHTLAVKNKTSEEAWSGHKPSVAHFKVFGCIGHVHIPDAMRTKLEDKSCKCIFLGISDESKGYRMYDPLEGKIVISRDVVFEESEHWNWDEKYQIDVATDLDQGEAESFSEEEQESEASEVNSDSASDSDAQDTGADVVEHSSSDTEAHRAPNEARTRRPPIWLDDYDSGVGLSDEEEEANIAGIENSDPDCYDIAVKHRKWIQAMDEEIASIVHMGTN